MGRGYIVVPNHEDIGDSVGAVATSRELAEQLIRDYKRGRIEKYPEPSYILHIPRDSGHPLLASSEIGVNGSGYLLVRPATKQVSVEQIRAKRDEPFVDLPRDLNQTHQIYHLLKPVARLPLTKEMLERALANLHQLGDQTLDWNGHIIPISWPLEETLELCAREMGFR